MMMVMTLLTVNILLVLNFVTDQAISSVAAALALDGVAKTRLNARDNYLYRSIDDVLGRLAPLLAKHRLCILPRVLDREASVRQDESGKALIAVTLKVAFDLVSAKDVSCHTIEAFGEALDPGDKAEFLESKSPSTEFQAFSQVMVSVALKALDHR